MAEIRELERKAVQIRKDLLTLIYRGKAGHTGGDLSCTDIMVALFYHYLRLRPDCPDWEDRDRFILSKGHCVETYYSVLADCGFFPKEELDTYMKFGTRLIGHPTNKVPGIEMNTGALGHGLSVGVGMALGLKHDGRDSRVVVLMGDGELEEGSVWEAAMAAAHYRLGGLIGIVDRNHLQIAGDTDEISCLNPLEDRFASFGWQVRTIDGNCMAEILEALEGCRRTADKPTMIIAETTKGKGVREMEGVAKWHHGVPDEELFKSAMQQLDALGKELS